MATDGFWNVDLITSEEEANLESLAGATDWSTMSGFELSNPYAYVHSCAERWISHQTERGLPRYTVCTTCTQHETLELNLGVYI